MRITCVLIPSFTVAVARRARIVHGYVERQERAVNVVTECMEPLKLGVAVPRERTHSFG